MLCKDYTATLEKNRIDKALSFEFLESSHRMLEVLLQCCRDYAKFKFYCITYVISSDRLAS